MDFTENTCTKTHPRPTGFLDHGLSLAEPITGMNKTPMEKTSLDPKMQTTGPSMMLRMMFTALVDTTTTAKPPTNSELPPLLTELRTDPTGLL